MPTIYDNIDLFLGKALQDALPNALGADFCVGYFNLRGWGMISSQIDTWPEERKARILVGMNRTPEDNLRSIFSLIPSSEYVDNSELQLRRREEAEKFRKQLTLGKQTNSDEIALRRLARQLRSGKVTVRLYLQKALHAKLYLLRTMDHHTPRVAYVGSSNLTFSGLKNQLELNVDVLDRDAADKLQQWFDDRWIERGCVDISQELAEIIEESWAREQLTSPYHVYLKIAYHLSQDARAGLSEFRVPKPFDTMLLPFQRAAVQIAAHHLTNRGGVLLGDVVGLGKTLMACALLKIAEEDARSKRAMIICPPNLEEMWQDHVEEYGLNARVVRLSRVQTELDEIKRYGIVLIDESHNLRNPESVRYRIVREYIAQNECKCVLLSATPYNKSYLDLAAQLGLFIQPDQELGIRPEAGIRAAGDEVRFLNGRQFGIRTLEAFKASDEPDDWRELMRRYMVRRTRSFIKENYSVATDDGRLTIPMSNGGEFTFPARIPKTIKIDDSEETQYGKLFSESVVDTIDQLKLPRYGLSMYLRADARSRASEADKEAMSGLNRAGKRLIGFCRTNLFKRLESGGDAFIRSLERHALRNFVFLHAIDQRLPFPIGAQELPKEHDPFNTQYSDIDAEATLGLGEPGDIPERHPGDLLNWDIEPTETVYRDLAEKQYRTSLNSLSKVTWLSTEYFDESLRADLLTDAFRILEVLQTVGSWDADDDPKLAELVKLIHEQHPTEKLLVFTQYADTVNYLIRELNQRRVRDVVGITGASSDPTMIAKRFSPDSNHMTEEQLAKAGGGIRVLISTDVLSEGQNLQDAAIVINYDLPWAIIRLIQRAGRVDRIGQRASKILCYTFLPANGIEQILSLRTRVTVRLKQNSDVLGSDDVFIEGGESTTAVVAIYNEHSGVLDDIDGEVDLASRAYEIWKKAIDRDKKLENLIAGMPNVMYATKSHVATVDQPDGVLLYMRTGDDNDALAWIDREGRLATESQLAVLLAAQCEPNERALERRLDHHDLVGMGIDKILAEVSHSGGQLGLSTGARFKTYHAIKRYLEKMQGTTIPFDAPDIDAAKRAQEEIYRAPLREGAKETLNRMLKSRASDEAIVRRVLELREDEHLTIPVSSETIAEPQVICSLGLVTR